MYVGCFFMSSSSHHGQCACTNGPSSLIIVNKSDIVFQTYRILMLCQCAACKMFFEYSQVLLPPFIKIYFFFYLCFSGAGPPQERIRVQWGWGFVAGDLWGPVPGWEDTVSDWCTLSPLEEIICDVLMAMLQAHDVQKPVKGLHCYPGEFQEFLWIAVKKKNDLVISSKNLHKPRKK